LGVATEDPLYETEKTNDWYLYMGVSFQLWDNMDRYRNINRERLRARQFQTDLKSQKTIEVRNWRQGRLQLNLKEADLNVAREDTKLEAFKEKQKLAQFRANQIKYRILADQSSDHLAAKITEIYREEDYQEALLSLALDSGWMLKRFVNQADVKDILR
jgi:hypothetical protein